MNSSDTLNPQVDQQNNSAQETSFADILSAFEQSQTQQQQQEGKPEGKQGTVVAVTPDHVVVDIGFKTEGIIPLDEFRDPAGKVDVQKGDQITVSIKGRTDEGYYLLSKIKVERPKDWSGLEKAFAEKSVIGGVITGVVKGGFTVDIGVRAFMPASRSGVRGDAAEMEKMVGQEISCRIIKLDVAKEDVVVDRRVVLEAEAAQAKQQAFEALKEGDVIKGTVKTLMDYGAFIDLGPVDGLLHVADISWGRVNKPSDVLKTGDTLEVKILKINRDSKRISLGLKQLSPDPWTLVESKYKAGDRVRGTVTRLTDFGAFVELEPGIEGLVHLSEMSWSKKARRPQDILKSGEAVEVVILGVNPGEKRISLGLKQALGDPWEGIEQKFPVGSVVEGRITNLAKFGAFVELGEGIEGMIHIGDISAEKRINHPQDELKSGETVKAQVLEIDRERRRLRLGIKQLQPTSADEYISEHKVGDSVTGRIVDVGRDSAKVELGEGVFAFCRLEKDKAEQKSAQPAPADLASLTAMLTAKWKQGGGTASSRKEPVRAGQVRNFRISSLDPSAKRIELELAV